MTEIRTRNLKSVAISAPDLEPALLLQDTNGEYSCYVLTAEGISGLLSSLISLASRPPRGALNLQEQLRGRTVAGTDIEFLNGRNRGEVAIRVSLDEAKQIGLVFTIPEPKVTEALSGIGKATSKIFQSKLN